MSSGTLSSNERQMVELAVVIYAHAASATAAATRVGQPRVGAFMASSSVLNEVTRPQVVWGRHKLTRTSSEEKTRLFI